MTLVLVSDKHCVVLMSGGIDIWVSDDARRLAAGVPEDRRSCRSKTELALEMLARTFTLANDLSDGTLLLRPTGMFCRRP